MLKAYRDRSATNSNIEAGLSHSTAIDMILSGAESCTGIAADVKATANVGTVLLAIITTLKIKKTNQSHENCWGKMENRFEDWCLLVGSHVWLRREWSASWRRLYHHCRCDFRRLDSLGWRAHNWSARKPNFAWPAAQGTDRFRTSADKWHILFPKNSFSMNNRLNLHVFTSSSWTEWNEKVRLWKCEKFNISHFLPHKCIYCYVENNKWNENNDIWKAKEERWLKRKEMIFLEYTYFKLYRRARYQNLNESWPLTFLH